MTLGHSERPEKACQGGLDPTTATARLWNRRSQELLSSSHSRRSGHHGCHLEPLASADL